MAPRDRLVAWLHGIPIAELERGRGDAIRLRYTPAALDTMPRNAPVLSCSLPLTARPLDATAFIDGLLPEGDARRHLAERARLPVQDQFGLIARYGRDVAGAVQLLVPEATPDSGERWRVEPLDVARLGALVDDLPSNPLALTQDSELSIAGLQDKMLLVAQPTGGWARPLGGQPSTHILKRDSERHVGIVRAECDGLALARHAGLTTGAAWIERYADVDCLLVERFDRVVDASGTVVARVHQEDSCQALGLPATRKYELHHGGGGPQLAQIADLLDRWATDSSAELDRLAALAAFTGIIGNADAHGKNVAFLLDRGTIRLAPAYDTVPTVLWPRLRSEAAMSLGGAVTFDAMNRGAIEREARRWRYGPAAAAEAAADCAERLLEAIALEVVDPDGPLAARVRRVAPRFLL